MPSSSEATAQYAGGAHPKRRFFYDQDVSTEHVPKREIASNFQMVKADMRSATCTCPEQYEARRLTAEGEWTPWYSLSDTENANAVTVAKRAVLSRTTEKV